MTPVSQGLLTAHGERVLRWVAVVRKRKKCSDVMSMYAITASPGPGWRYLMCTDRMADLTQGGVNLMRHDRLSCRMQHSTHTTCYLIPQEPMMSGPMLQT